MEWTTANTIATLALVLPLLVGLIAKVVQMVRRQDAQDARADAQDAEMKSVKEQLNRVEGAMNKSTMAQESLEAEMRRGFEKMGDTMNSLGREMSGVLATLKTLPKRRGDE